MIVSHHPAQASQSPLTRASNVSDDARHETSDTTLGAVYSALGTPLGEVSDVRGIVWVGGLSHLNMSLDSGRCRVHEMNLLSSLGTTCEHPLPCGLNREIPVLEPSQAFVRVSAFGPSPHLLPNLPVHLRECILTAHMPVIIGRIFKVIEIHRELLEPHRIRSRDSAKNT